MEPLSTGSPAVNLYFLIFFFFFEEKKIKIVIGSMYSQANVKPFGVHFNFGCWRPSSKGKVEEVFLFSPSVAESTKPPHISQGPESLGAKVVCFFTTSSFVGKVFVRRQKKCINNNLFLKISEKNKKTYINEEKCHRLGTLLRLMLLVSL